MKITLQNAKAAIERFNCVVSSGYPALADLFSIESETNGAVELYGYSNAPIADNQPGKTWLTELLASGGGVCPHTRGTMRPRTATPAKSLFGLVLAAVEFAGHLDAIKNDKEHEEFKAFTETADYTAALEQGRELLSTLVETPGRDLKSKIEMLEWPELEGSAGQIRLLEHTLGLDLNEFANYRAPGQPVPKEEDIDVEMELAKFASLEVENKHAEEKVAADREMELAIEASNAEAAAEKSRREQKEKQEERSALSSVNRAIQEEQVKQDQERYRESVLVEGRRLARVVAQQMMLGLQLKRACEQSVRIVVPSAPAVAISSVEVKQEREIPKQVAAPKRDRAQLNLAAKVVASALAFSESIGDKEGVLLALNEQVRIQQELEALPVQLVVAAPVEVKNQNEAAAPAIVPQARLRAERQKERARLENIAAAMPRVLELALESGIPANISAALQEEEDIKRALAALTLQDNAAAENRSAVLLSVNRTNIGASSGGRVLPLTPQSPK